MDTNINYTIVGAFVIALLSFVILGIIWLSSGFSIEQYSTYMVYMQESVTGLSVEAPVEYNGVNVGTVKSIQLNKKNPHLVELLLSIQDSAPITQGTTATLDLKGITGISFVALKDDGMNLAPLRAEHDQPYPVIKTAPSLFLRFDTAISKLNANLAKVSDSIQAVLDQENLRSIKQILIHLDRITYTFATNSQKLTTIMENTARASQQFSPAMQTLNTQTLPDVNRIIVNFDVLSNEIKQNPSILIRGTEPQPLGPGEK